MNHPIIMTVTKEEEAELLEATHGSTPGEKEPQKPVGKVKYEVKKPDFVPSSRIIGL